MVIQQRFCTADDLWALSHLPENAGKRFELLEGELVEMTLAGWLHKDVTGEFGARLRFFVKQHKLGLVTAAETGYILHKNSDPTGKDTVLAPDVGFIAAARIPKILPEHYVPFAPDLAVEVVSPSNTDEEISLKVELYLRYGTRLVWIVYPRQQRVHVYRPVEAANKGRFEFLDVNGVLDGEDVIPGFTLAIRDLFEGNV